jgi:hypothetical protein
MGPGIVPLSEVVACSVSMCWVLGHTLLLTPHTGRVGMAAAISGNPVLAIVEQDLGGRGHEVSGRRITNSTTGAASLLPAKLYLATARHSVTLPVHPASLVPQEAIFVKKRVRCA